MPAVRLPGVVTMPPRCRQCLTARHARPPSTSARPARPAILASSAARTATPSPVGSVRVVPAHIATSRSPSAICSSRETEVARPRTDSTFGARHLLLAALAYRAFVPQACYRKEAPSDLTDCPTGASGYAIIWGLSMASNGDFFVALDSKLDKTLLGVWVTGAFTHNRLWS